MRIVSFFVSVVCISASLGTKTSWSSEKTKMAGGVRAVKKVSEEDAAGIRRIQNDPDYLKNPIKRGAEFDAAMIKLADETRRKGPTERPVGFDAIAALLVR